MSWKLVGNRQSESIWSDELFHSRASSLFSSISCIKNFSRRENVELENVRNENLTRQYTKEIVCWIFPKGVTNYRYPCLHSRKRDKILSNEKKKKEKERKMHPFEAIIMTWLGSMVFALIDATDSDDYFSLDYTDESDYNATNCTNIYCISNEEYVDRMMNYIFPKFWDWVLIASHSIVFVIGLIGNALVCIAVYRNHTMRTVTNYFIVNLAVADFLVLLLCLPFTVLWDITETWFLGLTLCKAVPYLQVRQLRLDSFTIHFN